MRPSNSADEFDWINLPRTADGVKKSVELVAFNLCGSIPRSLLR